MQLVIISEFGESELFITLGKYEVRVLLKLFIKLLDDLGLLEIDLLWVLEYFNVSSFFSGDVFELINQHYYLLTNWYMFETLLIVADMTQLKKVLFKAKVGQIL
jgi:hypothetical protein